MLSNKAKEKSMVCPDFEKWGQTVEELRELSIKTPHLCNRERYKPLHIKNIAKTMFRNIRKVSEQMPKLYSQDLRERVMKSYDGCQDKV